MRSGRRQKVHVTGLPGEEVADRVGISADYYKELEQGRRLVSMDLLTLLVQALQVPLEEQRYLFTLVFGMVPAHLQVATRTVTAALQGMLDSLQPTPAYIGNHLWDVMAWNPPRVRFWPTSPH